MAAALLDVKNESELNQIHMLHFLTLGFYLKFDRKPYTRMLFSCLNHFDSNVLLCFYERKCHYGPKSHKQIFSGIYLSTGDLQCPTISICSIIIAT